MKCPVCRAELSPSSSGSHIIDVCPQCGGIWFDSTELSDVAKDMIQNDAAQDQKTAVAFQSRSKPADGEELKKFCPRCGILTEVFNYCYDSNIFLDKCPSCHGLWADRGELERVVQYLKRNPVVNRYVEPLASESHKTSKQSVISRLVQSRLLSSMVASLYLGEAISAGHSLRIWRVVVFLILPFVCIWFSDRLGGYMEFLKFPRPAITKKTPGFFVALLGWMLFLTPLVIVIVSVITK